MLGAYGIFSTEGMELTHLLVVGDTRRSRTFCRDTLEAEVYREYGTSCVLQFQGTWLLLVTAGELTGDKPGVRFAPLSKPDTISHEMTIRVPDCHAAYEVLKSRGAEFLTPPVDWGAEIRASSGARTATSSRSARHAKAGRLLEVRNPWDSRI